MFKKKRKSIFYPIALLSLACWIHAETMSANVPVKSLDESVQKNAGLTASVVKEPEQSNVVRGTVTDASSLPLIGVSIMQSAGV